jgi:hypothetical protein
MVPSLTAVKKLENWRFFPLVLAHLLVYTETDHKNKVPAALSMMPTWAMFKADW